MNITPASRTGDGRRAGTRISFCANAISRRAVRFLGVALIAGFVGSCDEVITPLTCPENERITSQMQAIDLAKKMIFEIDEYTHIHLNDEMSNGVSSGEKERKNERNRIWIKIFDSDLYKYPNNIGKFIDGNGWFVGTIKHDQYYFFEVVFSFDDGEISAHLSASMNACGAFADETMHDIIHSQKQELNKLNQGRYR